MSLCRISCFILLNVGFYFMILLFGHKMYAMHKINNFLIFKVYYQHCRLPDPSSCVNLFISISNTDCENVDFKTGMVNSTMRRHHLNCWSYPAVVVGFLSYYLFINHCDIYPDCPFSYTITIIEILYYLTIHSTRDLPVSNIILPI